MAGSSGDLGTSRTSATWSAYWLSSTVLGDVAVDSARTSGIEVVDPTPWLCYQGECPIVIGGTLSYRDTDHITTEYAANLWGELGSALHMLPTTVE